jgi:hypothetical protein
MKDRSLLVAVTVLACVFPAYGATVQSRRANISGGGGNGGKCTIEVEIDDTAEVEVYGDQGRIQTLSGSPSNWRRFECTSPLPRNPVDFRFRGIDGRGRVELIRDPRNSGGRAVVRIQDSQGGREGYTFDLEWRGGDSSNGRGFPDDRRYPDDRRSPDDRRYPDDRSDRGYPERRGDGNRFTFAEAINVCKDAVRDKAQRQYGVREVDFLNVDPDNNPGRNDWVVGSFEGRRGGGRDRFNFSCSVDFSSGRVRSVDVRRR